MAVAGVVGYRVGSATGSVNFAVKLGGVGLSDVPFGDAVEREQQVVVSQPFDLLLDVLGQYLDVIRSAVKRVKGVEFHVGEMRVSVLKDLNHHRFVGTHGILGVHRQEQHVVDPLVMPIGAINTAGRQVMHLVRRLREELKVNTTCGASNVSFGLPNRNGINAAFLPMAMASGMTSAITNPLHEEVVRAVLGADVMMGHDPDCARWIKKHRVLQAADAGSARREGGRRRRRN